MKEFELIKACFSDWPIAKDGLLVGIGDDALVWAGMGPLVVSTDTCVENRHFPSFASPAEVAQRAFLPAISDLAAMGASPAFFTLALTLPSDKNSEWVMAFGARLKALALEYDIPLAGGDTTQGKCLTLTLSVHGLCPHPVMRSGAQVGDDVWVSGHLGQASAALQPILKRQTEGTPAAWLNRYWHPIPRLDLAQGLVGIIHSCIDISDGLIGDAAHIAKASGVKLVVDVSQIPMDSQLSLLDNALEHALAGGDDYELCFTASKVVRAEIEDISTQLRIPLQRIGKVEAGESEVIWVDQGTPVELTFHSFSHF